MTHQTTITPDPDGNGVILHLPEITHLDTQVWSADVGLTAEGLAALRTALAAVSAAVAPPTDRAALRDRIRLAIARQWLEEMGSDRTADELDDAEFGSFADAVLAVLPEPTDRAAVLREAADRAEVVALRLRLRHDTGAANGAYEVMDELRRMADETATETPQRERVKHSGPDTKFCVLCLSGEHERGDEPAAGARQDGAET